MLKKSFVGYFFIILLFTFSFSTISFCNSTKEDIEFNGLKMSPIYFKETVRRGDKLTLKINVNNNSGEEEKIVFKVKDAVRNEDKIVPVEEKIEDGIASWFDDRIVISTYEKGENEIVLEASVPENTSFGERTAYIYASRDMSTTNGEMTSGMIVQSQLGIGLVVFVTDDKGEFKIEENWEPSYTKKFSIPILSQLQLITPEIHI